jgi:protein O-GlcNAc transferase
MGPTRYPCRVSSLGRGAILIVLALVPAHSASAQHPGVAAPVANHKSVSPTALAQARKQFALGHYAETVSLFHAALAGPRPPRLSDTDALSYATALAATGNIPAAEQQLTDALSRVPNSAPLNDALGTLTAQSGHVDASLPYFQRAVATDPSLAQAQYHLGTALLALHQPDAAISALRLAVAAMPSNFSAQLQLGNALSATHQDAEALTHLHLAAQLRSPTTSHDALYALALALQASGDAKSSLPIFAAATSTPGASVSASGSDALTNYALAHVQTGDAANALPLYQRALAMGPDTPTLREDFGVAYLQQSDLDHAMQQFRAGLTLEPDNAHLHYDLGLALKLKDDLASAVPEFLRAEQLDPSLPDPPFTLGVIYMQQGRFPDAITQLKHAAELQPNNGDAWALLGSVLKDSNDAAGATEALTHAVALEPDQPSLHIQLAALDVEAGKRTEAAAERKIAADLSRAANNRQRAGFALKSGRMLLDQNKLSDAILQLNTAVQADPTLAKPHFLLAEAYTRQGKPTEAAAERKLATALSPTQP